MANLRSCCRVVYLLAARKYYRKAPLNRAGFHTHRPVETTETMRKNMPSARRTGTFAYFCGRAKVWRSAVREPPVLILNFGTILKLNTAGPARQPGVFLCWSKERHQRKDQRGACICVCVVAVFLRAFVKTFKAALRGKETKGALPSGPPR